VRPEWVAGLEDPGHSRMVLQYLAEPMGQDFQLVVPAQGGVLVDVDLGQHIVKD
jgi:hypothetical protein